MKKLGLLVMPIMVISLLASCGNNNKRVTIAKCNLDGAVSLFSRKPNDSLKLKSSNKNEVNPSGLIKRTMDSVMSAPLLDPNGNEVSYEVHRVSHFDDNYVFIDGTVPSYGTKNLLLNTNSGEIIETPRYFSVPYNNYKEAPFTKKCYYDNDGNMFVAGSNIDGDAVTVNENGIYLFDKNGKTLNKYVLPEDYKIGGWYSYFIVKENREMVSSAFKINNDTGDIIDEKIFYVDENGNSKLVELPYDISKPELILSTEFERDKVFLGLDNKFYYLQQPLSVGTKETIELKRKSTLYQIDFSKTKKDEIYIKLWEDDEDQDHLARPRNLYTIENKQVVFFYPVYYSDNNYKTPYVTLDYANPSNVTCNYNKIETDFNLTPSFQKDNFMYAHKYIARAGDVTYHYYHYLMKYDLNNLNSEPETVITFPDDGFFPLMFGISYDGKVISGYGGYDDHPNTSFSFIYDLSSASPKVEVLKVIDNPNMDYIPL